MKELKNVIKDLKRVVDYFEDLDRDELQNITEEAIIYLQNNEGRLEQQVREKFMETIDEWKESIKANIEEAIDSQEQENREEYHHGIEVASKYAIEMMDKHLELNKFSA